MTAESPDDRYRTMADVLVAIQRIERTLGLDTLAPVARPRPAPPPITPEPEPEPEQPRR